MLPFGFGLSKRLLEGLGRIACKLLRISSQEIADGPSVRRARWANLEALQKAGTRETMAKLIGESLPKAAKIGAFM